jgi:putative transposase
MDKFKANATAYYGSNGKSVISFPQDSKKERVIEFLRKMSKENRGKGILMVLDNYKSHKAKEVTKEAGRLRIELVFLPPYSPDLNPIEYVWKSIKRVISATFIRHIDDMRNVIKEAFYQPSRSFAKGNSENGRATSWY